VLWEAQFDDFVDGGQIIVDRFLVSPRRQMELAQRTGLLPHRFEGQGLEH
jgi:2-oxoglutarate dehydrogenase E1 component